MLSRTSFVLCISISLILFSDYSFAGEEEAIVWIADGVSIEGNDNLELYPTSNDTGNEFEIDVTGLLTNATRTELKKAGLNVVDHVAGRHTADVGLRLSLVHYQSGSVGGRWVGFGEGAAICIIRAYLFDSASEQQIADIIVAEQVGSGGMFTVGAEEYVLENAARKITEELAALLDIELASREVSK
ncbi:MAG: hypothetical protein JSU95_05110 [Betaproteobacteria bacterium]|nr:MAG: hypothetical protein JSU95_05110 [Betaproteobacteria bacterium]